MWDPETWDIVFLVLGVEIFCKIIGESAVRSEIMNRDWDNS